MVVAFALLSLPGAAALFAQQPPRTVAQLAELIDAQISQLEKSTTLESVVELPASLSQEMDELKQRSVMLFGDRRKRWNENYRRLQESIDNLTTAVGTDPARLRGALTEMRMTWTAMKSQYPCEALKVLPALWTCPMHSELMLSKAGTCPVCGMPLDPIYVTQPQLTQEPIIRAEIRVKAPLEVGKKAELRIRLLFTKDGRPVQLDDLEETHTRKIHLLISDLSETDYHHVHPEQVGDGDYAFSFIPARPGTYRVWADLQPVLTHVQQYSVADIPSTTPQQGTLAAQETENRYAEIDGYKFDLSFAKSLIHEKETVPGTLRVTGPDGQPFNKLEVVMGAFGHFVGFCDDFATVLHIHPVGPLIESPDLRGGPELPFYFRSSKPGLVRFFAQVKIGGKDMYPRFIINVQPLQHLPSF